jgi:[acyl-carrier-protein] S-malonyltransferase
LLAEGPAEALAQTVNTQPVMLTAGVAVYRLWLDRGGKVPAVLAGHSLGEYSALVAAGVIAFADAVPLVRLRAAAMQEAVPAGAGAMAAILGLDDDRIADACAEAEAAVGAAGSLNRSISMGPGRPSSPEARPRSSAPAKRARRVAPSAPCCCRFQHPSTPR